MWPAGRFIALAQKLTGPEGLLPGARIAILGGPGDAEREMATPALAALPEAVDLVGVLSLPEVAAVLARALARWAYRGREEDVNWRKTGLQPF